MTFCDLILTTMLALEQVSVINDFFLSNNDLKGTTNKLSSGHISNSKDNSEGNRSFAKTPCSVSGVKTSCFAEFKHPSNTPPLDQLEL